MSKIAIYGSRLCTDTVEALETLEREKIVYEYFDMTDSLANLRTFLKYRDTHPVYDGVRGQGGIGIPLFVIGSGDRQFVTLDLSEALKHIDARLTS